MYCISENKVDNGTGYRYSDNVATQTADSFLPMVSPTSKASRELHAADLASIRINRRGQTQAGYTFRQ